jgi:glycosyltransferase involved in cell wall biosynthesis
MVSLVISAFNEADVIREKIENALALNYPPHRREIVVISDASDDGTDEIVSGFADRGVRLARQPERRGKTEGRCVKQLPTRRNGGRSAEVEFSKL